MSDINAHAVRERFHFKLVDLTDPSAVRAFFAAWRRVAFPCSFFPQCSPHRCEFDLQKLLAVIHLAGLKSVKESCENPVKVRY